jgi:tyrosine-protein kinase Fer
MGFSSNLQGRAAHEALLCRQDAELRLLDTMRRCLANKVKCDREYAVAIASVALQGQKLERTEDLVGSLVAQASYILFSKLLFRKLCKVHSILYRDIYSAIYT